MGIFPIAQFGLLGLLPAHRDLGHILEEYGYVRELSRIVGGAPSFALLGVGHRPGLHLRSPERRSKACRSPVQNSPLAVENPLDFLPEQSVYAAERRVAWSEFRSGWGVLRG